MFVICFYPFSNILWVREKGDLYIYNSYNIDVCLRKFLFLASEIEFPIGNSIINFYNIVWQSKHKLLINII